MQRTPTDPHRPIDREAARKLDGEFDAKMRSLLAVRELLPIALVVAARGRRRTGGRMR